MERVNFNYSSKNIATTSRKHYLKCLISKTETLMKNMRWRAFYFLNPKVKRCEKKTYGFNSRKAPPFIKELAYINYESSNITYNSQC